jgi:hypothetical protein
MFHTWHYFICRARFSMNKIHFFLLKYLNHITMAEKSFYDILLFTFLLSSRIYLVDLAFMCLFNDLPSKKSSGIFSSDCIPFRWWCWEWKRIKRTENPSPCFHNYTAEKAKAFFVWSKLPALECCCCKHIIIDALHFNAFLLRKKNSVDKALSRHIKKPIIFLFTNSQINSLPTFTVIHGS